LLDLRGLTRVKHQKRERDSRPQVVVVPVRNRKTRPVVDLEQTAERAVETTSAVVATDAVEAVMYKPVEEVIEADDSEDASTITIYVVMHHGKRVRATFKRSDTLQHLRDYIAAHTPQVGAVFSMWGGRPRALLTNMNQLLVAGNLMQATVQQRVPNAVLQAALRRVLARVRYFQRLETEASVMKLSATESRLRRLTEEMRNHSTVMQEAHELEVAEEQRLLAVVAEAMAQKKRERRVSRASVSKGSGEMIDDGLSEEWGSDASCGSLACDSGTESPKSPMKGSLRVESTADTPLRRAKQLPLSPVALQRLHTQVVGLDLLSPLRRRLHVKKFTSVNATTHHSHSPPKVSPSTQLPTQVSEQSPRALMRATAVSDAERLKRMWKERRFTAQRPAPLSAQGRKLHSAIPNCGFSDGTLPSTVEQSIPSEPALDTSATSHAQEISGAGDPLSRFGYRASLQHQSEAERSRRRLRL
jgi:hypothetical protein